MFRTAILKTEQMTTMGWNIADWSPMDILDVSWDFCVGIIFWMITYTLQTSWQPTFHHLLMFFPTKRHLLRMFTWNVWLPVFNSERSSSNFDPSMTPKLRSWTKNLCSIHSTVVVQSGCRTVFVAFAYLHSDIVQQHVTFPYCIYLFTDVHKWYLNGFPNEQQNTTCTV